MEVPKLVIDKDIAQFDQAAEMWGEGQPVFSSTNLSEFLDSNSEAETIEVEIRSDGGSTSEARIIYDMLRNSGKKIITKGYKVNSSAVVIFLAGDERLIAENADFLIHPVWIDPMGLPFMLTGEDLQTYADEIKNEENKLRNLYMSVIGEDKREEVTTLMDSSTNLSNVKAIELGFATGRLEETATKSENKKVLAFNNKMAAIVIKNKNNQKQNQIDMSNETANKALDLVNKALDKWGFKNETPNETPETQNASAELSEGGSVYFDGELADGSAVFSDEAMESPMADGDYALADGRTVSVADGAVTSIEAAASEDTENKEVTALNEKVEALEAKNVELEALLNKTTTTLNKLVPVMENLVPKHDEKKNTKKQDFNNMSTAERALAVSK